MRTKNKVTASIFHISVLVTITTILSSTIQLAQGIQYDTNTHILLRVVICVIAVAFYNVFKNIKIDNILLKALIQYVLSMGLILGLLFILGFFLELSETAYRDIFLNYTIPFILIAGTIIYKSRKNGKKNELNGR